MYCIHTGPVNSAVLLTNQFQGIIMSNKKIYTTAVAISILLSTTAANSFPTKVKLLKDPNYASTEGTSVIVTTDKGTIEEGQNQWGVYDAFEKAKKGSCYIFETETESNVKFNKKLDKSDVRSIKKVNC